MPRLRKVFAAVVVCGLPVERGGGSFRGGVERGGF